MYLTITRSAPGPVYYVHWGWVEKGRFTQSPVDKWEFWYWLEEGWGFLHTASPLFDYPEDDRYDSARCGAFADWLDENKDRLLEPHTDLRAEAEERLDSLIRWLRSGLQPRVE